MRRSGAGALMGRGDKIHRAIAPDTGSIIQRETPQISRKPQKRMRGGQPGNRNAVTHGRFSAAGRAERGVAAQERAQQSREWLKAMPKTDYGAICEAIKTHPGAPPRNGPLRCHADRDRQHQR
jgi:hypothetical protein